MKQSSSKININLNLNISEQVVSGASGWAGPEPPCNDNTVAQTSDIIAAPNSGPTAFLRIYNAVTQTLLTSLTSLTDPQLITLLTSSPF